jgi:electron transport complex protein RnfG
MMAEPKKQKSSIVKDAVALFLITLIAGALLGLVNQITKEPIAKSELAAKEEAYKVVFTKGDKFAENKEIDKKLNGAEFDGAEISEILEVQDKSGKAMGYVCSLVAKEGYGGDINFTIGVDTSGKMTGLSVLSHSETAGLGANCTEKDFTKQFVGLQGPDVAYTKEGKSADNEFDALSGATITTKALTKAINAGLGFLSENGYIAGK